MLWQQITVILLCVLQLSHSTFAVVNNGKSIALSDGDSSNNSNTNSASSTSSDSATASSDKEANRRELPARGLSDSYGVPIPSNSYGLPLDIYGSPVHSNLGLPVPVYGVPDRPTKNVVYPAPPPDIPPPLPSIPSFPVTHTYGPPKPVYGPPLKLHIPTYHKAQFHKSLFSPNFGHGSFKIPKLSYGPPSPAFIPKPQYGPPKPVYGPPKLSKLFFGSPLKMNFVPPKPLFVPTKPVHGPIKLTGAFGSSLATYGPPHTTSLLPAYGPPHPHLGPVFNPPKIEYRPPKEILNNPPPSLQPIPIYGSPDPAPHGPPHPGAPAPPTRPDIKYDGWQPILGLVSHPPSDLYKAPQQGDYANHGSVVLTPPVQNDLSLTYASSFTHGIGGTAGSISHSIHTPSDSYGAPLNTVTGSGGVVNSSGNDHVSFSHSHLHEGGSFRNPSGWDDSALSVIKSIGYEIFPNSGNKGPIDSYSAPPADSFSPDGPYDIKSFGSSGVGLIPPSGIYGVPPGGQYGAPFSSPLKNFEIPSGSYGPPAQLNALEINPPKVPVVFREPVPPGLLASIGESVAHKDAHGIEHSQSQFQGQAYIPPPVSDITKQKNTGGASVNPPSNLYSLPNTGSPTSFQSLVHDVNSNGLAGDFESTSFNFGGDHSSTGSLHFVGDQSSTGALTSYTAPLGVIDSSYGIPLQPQGLTAGFDQTLDFTKSKFGGYFTSSFAAPQISLQPTLALPIHDCSQHKSQPINTYEIPSSSGSSYAASISSLNTNIGGQSNYQVPTFNFVNPDLQAVHSNPTSDQSVLRSNGVDIQGKSLDQDYFGKDAKFQQSYNIQIPNGVQNIPIQGNLGSYTLQIQSADDLSEQGQYRENIPHEQVLSEGLLQSILSAIEQPQQQNQLQQQHLQQRESQQEYIQGYGDLQHGSSDPAISYQQQTSPVADGEAQHSVTSQVVINPPAQENGNSTPKPVEATTNIVSDTDQSLPLIGNNEIALYFNNNYENRNDQVSSSSSESSAEDSGEVRNGQQYGNFVSLKIPHSSYVYGELKTNNSTQSAAEKIH